MNIDDLKEIVVKQYGKDLPKYGVSDDRIKQYSDIFGMDNAGEISSILNNIDAHSAGGIVTEARVQKIFESNPQISKIRQNCEFRIIESDQESTKKIQFVDGKYIILFDTFTALYI